VVGIEDGGELREVGDVSERGATVHHAVQDAAQRPHVRPERYLPHTISNQITIYLIQSTAHHSIHFVLSDALILRALVLISNCKCIAQRAVDLILII
jgi:hypothetical protein